MAKGSFPIVKVIGLAFTVIGIGVIIWGLQLSDSVSNELTELVTGSPKDRVMQYYIGGAVSLVIGLFLVAKK